MEEQYESINQIQESLRVEVVPKSIQIETSLFEEDGKKP